MIDIEFILTSIESEKVQFFRSKFPSWSDDKFEVVFEEAIKMITIALWMDDIFLPCTEEVDQVWHELILETKTYRSLCQRIHPGRFLDHTGITFSDYQASVHPGEIQSTQLSVLATYVASFGDFTSESLKYWGVAREMAEKNGWNIEDINAFCRRIALSGNLVKVANVEDA